MSMDRISWRDSNLSSWLWKVGIIALAAGIVLGLQAYHPSSLPSYAATPPAFARPVVSGIQGLGYEQDIRIDTHGRTYTSVPDGGPTGSSWIWRSLDHGKTFKWIPNATPITGTVQMCQGGGDTELATDSKDNLYANILSLANFSTARSSDQGTNFTPPACTAVTGAGVDRQWYAVDGDPTTTGSLYLAYDAVVQGTPTCPGGAAPNNEMVLARSPAAGVGATAGVVFAPPKSITGPCNEGIMGNNEVSPVTHHIFIPHNTDQYDQIRMGRCQAVDFTVDPTGLSCVDLPVAAFTGTAVAAGNFTTMAIDSAGKLYVVWEQAGCSPCHFGPQNMPSATITSNTHLMFSSSADEGATWSAPRELAMPGLNNAVYAFAAGGDAGRLDVAFYGTASVPPCLGAATCAGPDAIYGDWGVYMLQTLDGGLTWSPPILASEHFVHRGSLQTLIGGQAGDRTLGDFMQMRIGLSGEANITYGESNNIGSPLHLAQAMFVRQNAGSTVLARKPVYCGVPAQTNRVFDPSGDATFDAAGRVGAYQPNMDILESDISQPDPQHYQVRMTVADLTSLLPSDPLEGSTLVWSTQWHVPSSTDPNGGKIFHAYMEATKGSAPTFWEGENGFFAGNGGNGMVDYPGTNQVTGTFTAGAPAVITISIPASLVTEAGAISSNLYSVTAATMSLASPASENAPTLSGIGGVPFNLVDVAEPYDYIPGARPTSGQSTCGRTTPSASASGPRSDGAGDRDEDNADDDVGISDEEYALGLPTWILDLVDPAVPGVPTSPIPSPSVPALP